MDFATAKMKAMDVGLFLEQFGLAIGANGVEIVDFTEVDTCHVHHTQETVVATGYALVSPTIARGKFPNLSFLALVAKRLQMDQIEVSSFAAICGIEALAAQATKEPLFSEHLWKMIEVYDLGAFFENVKEGGRGHYAMRPRGRDWSQPDWPEIPGAIAQWRKAYKQLPAIKQILVTTIMTLYRGMKDETWMVRVPKQWHAAEAIEILRENEAVFKDWARLYVLYPGW